MLYRPLSFRNVAIGLTAGATMIAFASFPAAAQKTSAVNFKGAPACEAITNSTAGIKCEIKESERRTQDAIKRGAEADRRGAAADARGAKATAESSAAKASTSCMAGVEKDIEEAKAKGPLTPSAKAMFKSRIEKCDKIS